MVRSDHNSRHNWLDVYVSNISQPSSKRKLQSGLVLCEIVAYTDIKLMKDLFVIRLSISIKGKLKVSCVVLLCELRAEVTVELPLTKIVIFRLQTETHR